MKCLNCSNEMINHDVYTKKQNMAYDLCEECGSLWLDKGEFDKMAFQVEGSVECCSKKLSDDANLDDEKIKHCPRLHALLV